MKAIGLMSGTSADGVDAVLLELQALDRRHRPEVRAHAYHAYPAPLRQLFRDPANLTVPQLASLPFELAEIYAHTVRQLPNWQEATCVGMHGQTVWHAPPSSGATPPHTLQLGSSAALAAQLELPVVGDLRSADLVRGGEGAPIVPFAHWFFADPSCGRHAVINIGGIANYTLVTPKLEDVRGSDLGPGMMITDALAIMASGGTVDHDRDGQWSGHATPQSDVVAHILAHPFFARPKPRTTGREDFGQAFAHHLAATFNTATPAALIASSLEATAQIIANFADQYDPALAVLRLTGGGSRHPGLVQRIERRLATTTVEIEEDGVYAPNHHEPAAMALIAARTLARLPSSLPAVTGAREASILGHVAWPSSHA